MTWQEFTTGLTAVARTGSTQALPIETTASLIGLGMIAGSEGGDEGVYLTEIGRGWYQTSVIDRENEGILGAYAGVIDRFFDHLEGGD